MYVTPELVKEHCAVTSEISDALLLFYIDAAEARAATYLNRPLSSMLTPIDSGDMADPIEASAVKHAIMLYVMDAIEQRGTLVVGTIASEMKTAENLLHPYRINMGV